jgi:uncharacterized protein (DUF427 family)
MLPRGVVAEIPGPDQESVWDYPRPPRLEATGEHVIVVLGGVVVCDTSHPIRVLETSHPPSYYLPRQDWLAGSLRPAAGASHCEFKGAATYLDVVAGSTVASRVAWSYSEPWTGFESLAGHIAVYPEAMDHCTVNGEIVGAQPGGFYGGWVTSRVVGPFKGAPGSMGW